MSLKDVYEEHGKQIADLILAVGEIRGSNLHISGQLTTLITEARSTHNDHENRLRSMEKWKYAVPLTLITSFGLAAASVL